MHTTGLNAGKYFQMLEEVKDFWAGKSFWAGALTGRNTMAQTISLKSISMSRQNKDRAKLFARVEGQKLHGANFTLYTVYGHIIVFGSIYKYAKQ